MLNSLFRVVAPKPDAPAPVAEPFDPLLAEREAAAAGLARFEPFGHAVSEAHAALEAAKAASRAFLDAERQALAAWADAGEGEPPLRDKARHGALQAAIEHAERDLSDAEAASRTIEPARAKALAALHGVALKIDRRRADAIVAEVLREVDELAAVMGDAKKRHARILAAREALFEYGRGLSDGRSMDRGAIYSGAAGRIGDVPVAIQCRPTHAEIQTEVAPWRVKIEE